MPGLPGAGFEPAKAVADPPDHESGAFPNSATLAHFFPSAAAVLITRVFESERERSVKVLASLGVIIR